MLLLILAGFSIWRLGGANENFQAYRSMARQANEIGRVQANMLEARIGVKDFIETGNPQNQQVVEERTTNAVKFIETVHELVGDGEHDALLDTLKNDILAYRSAFDDIVQKRAERNAIVGGTLNTQVVAIERNLSKIMHSAFDDGDPDAAYRAGLALRHLLLARLYGQKFLIENDVASVERVNQEFEAFESEMGIMEGELQNPERRELAAEVVTGAQTYRVGFDEVVEIIQARNAIVTEKLNRIGPEIAGEVGTGVEQHRRQGG